MDFQPLLTNHARWRNDSLLWLRETFPTTPLVQQKFFHSLPKSSNYFAVIKKDDKNEPLIVGICGLTDINMTHKNAEFSLLIGTEYQQNGYGTKALNQLLVYGFDTLELQLIYGETFSYPKVHGINPGAKAYEKLGFTLDGTLRKRYLKYGQWVDVLVYSLLKSEFKRPIS